MVVMSPVPWRICVTVACDLARVSSSAVQQCLRPSTLDSIDVPRFSFSRARTTYDVTRVERSDHQRTVAVSTPFYVWSPLAETLTSVHNLVLELVHRSTHFLLCFCPLLHRIVFANSYYEGSLTEFASRHDHPDRWTVCAIQSMHFV